MGSVRLLSTSRAVRRAEKRRQGLRRLDRIPEIIAAAALMYCAPAALAQPFHPDGADGLNGGAALVVIIAVLVAGLVLQSTKRRMY
ncbi:MAG: hypothetical protein P8008_05805 [Gammaproteobacteria bacterium]